MCPYSYKHDLVYFEHYTIVSNHNVTLSMEIGQVSFMIRIICNSPLSAGK